MSQIMSYGKIPHLDSPDAPGILFGGVVVEEKVDGAQFSFMRDPDRGVIFQSRRFVLEVGKMDFGAGTTALSEIADLIPPGIVFVGEYLARPKQNLIPYLRVPTRHVILFDGYDSVTGKWLSRGMLEAYAKRMGLEVVPVLFQGNADGLTREKLQELASGESILGGPREGVVIKRHKILVETGFLKAKFINPLYTETRTGRKKLKAADTFADDIANRYVTPMRLAKCLQRLEEEGGRHGSRKDIGPLIAHLQRDIEEEHAEEIKQQLWAVKRKEILRACASHVAPWYMEKLREEFFADEAASCPHGEPHSECNTCMVMSDLAYDAGREGR